MSTILAADGSAKTDAHPTVTVDLSNELERWRYTCPRGHFGGSWSPTNSHIYCNGCRRQMDAGEDVSPEHYELVDTKTGERIPYSAFEFVTP